MMLQILALLLCSGVSSSAWANGSFEGEFISPPSLFPANHSATQVELPSGDLLACWYAGSREMGRDVQIYCAQKALTGGTWSEPRVAVAARERAKWGWLKNKSIGNPVLYLDSENVLWLFYGSIVIGGWSGSRVDYKTSRDFGMSWSRSRRLTWRFGNLTRTKPLKIDDEHFMLPLNHELIQDNSYTCVLRVQQGKIKARECHEIQQLGSQPSLVRHDGRIWAYMRNQKQGNVLYSVYDSENHSWSLAAPTNLPNPDASVDAVSLNDGRVLIAYNDSSAIRSPLSLAVSTDGVTFTKMIDVEADPSREFSYPSLIKTSDGFFHLSYTYDHRSAIKHIRFDQQWLAGQTTTIEPAPQR